MPILVRLWFFVLLLSAFGLDAASAQGRRQEIIIQGWRYEQGPDQVERYICEKPECGSDTLVSYQIQPVKTGYTLADFRREKTEVYKTLGQNLLSGGPLRIGVARATKLRITPLMVIDVAGKLSNGQPHARFSGYLLGRNHSVSLISSAANRGLARKNFDIFAITLAVQEGVSGMKFGGVK